MYMYNNVLNVLLKLTRITEIMLVRNVYSIFKDCRLF